MQVLKRLSALLLMICFVLPLSTCSTKTEVNGVVKVKDTQQYGYQLAEQSIEHMSNGNRLDGALTAIMVLNAFFFPLIAMRIRQPWQAPATFIASLFALLSLYFWTFAFVTHADVGGLLAIGTWIVLSLLALYECILAIRQGYANNQNNKTPIQV